MRPNWLNALYALAALAFAFLCAAGGWRAWQVGGALKATVEQYGKTGKSASELTERVNKFITEDELKNIKKNFDTSIQSGQQTATGATLTAGAVYDTLVKHAQPMIDDFRKRGNAQIEATTELTNELKRQIEGNGNRAQALLLEGENTIREARLIIVDSREDFIAAVKSLKQAGYQAEILTDQDHLGKASLELAETLEHTADITGSGAAIGKDIENLSAAKIRPLYEPQKRGFFGKFLNAFSTVVKFTRGASTIIVLAGQF